MMRRFEVSRGFWGVATVALLVIVACASEEHTQTPAPTAAPAIALTPTPVPIAKPIMKEEVAKTLQWTKPPPMAIDASKEYTAVLKTSKGDITIELFASEVPNTVNNFIFLAKEGFYEGVKFHRIVRTFMVQTGDPTGTGMGGPGYRFADEPVSRDYLRGTLAMANAGPNTNGSQFFIVHQDYPLPKNYVIFGRVTQGLDTLDAIANTPVTVGSGGERSMPTEKVTIDSVEIR